MSSAESGQHASPRGLAVGLDLGTSGLKAVAVDESGACIARSSVAYPTHRPTPGASEQDPADWTRAIASATRDIKEQTDSAPWSVIGLSGMLPTLVAVRPDGQALGYAVTWEDARAEEQGERFRTAFGGQAMYARTGQWVDGRYLLPMFHRLADQWSPRQRREPTLILGAKDFIFGWLTGTPMTDPSTAAGFGAYDLTTGAWDPHLIRLATDVSGTQPTLPDVMSSRYLGRLTEAAARALELPIGTPVCLGAADSVLGAFGMGVTQPGDIAYVGGTSTIVLGITSQLTMDDRHRFLVTPLADTGRWGLEMDLLATGAAIRWLASILGLPSEAEVLRLAAQSTAEPPDFLPYLAPGEQGALWDPDLSGVILGLHLGHSKADICRALINGIICESRRCMATLADHGFIEEAVTVSGGSASDPWFAQQLSNATGRPVRLPTANETDSSALGAALLGATAIGRDALMPRPAESTLLPEPSAISVWDYRAERHDSALARSRALT